MSFIFTITLSPNDELTKDELITWISSDSKIELSLNKPIFSRQGRTLTIKKRNEGSEGFLTDNADPDAEYWDMYPELLPELANLVKTIRRNTKSSFVFEAHWIGEGSHQTTSISIDELVQMIESGKLKTKTNLLVG